MSSPKLLVILKFFLIIMAIDQTYGSPSPQATAVIMGRVRDASTGNPLGFATTYLQEIRRGTIAHGEGDFQFTDVPSGHHTLRITYLGFTPVTLMLSVSPNDTVRVEVAMEPSRLASRTVVVRGRTLAGGESASTQALQGTDLQRRLTETIASTLQNEPGMDFRSMGGATARPVVRGLGGDRMAVLQDGGDAGDLSATSPDHAVSIDPLSAERIEVVRGPAALTYTSNALGGVVNVVTDRIASTMPDHMHGALSLYGETANRSYAGAMLLALPLGPLAVHIDATARHGGDIETPAGRLGNSGAAGHTASLAASFPWGSGHGGMAAGVYRNDYGIPGGFVGAHPQGVRIEMNRRWGEARAEFLPEGTFVRRVEFRSGIKQYRHREFESNGAIGTDFSVRSTSIMLMVEHDSLESFAYGAFGVQLEQRDTEAGGSALIPTTRESSAALFLYEGGTVGPVALRGAIRYDARASIPERDVTTVAGNVRRRGFSGFSASIDATVPFSSTMSGSATVMHSFRTPSIEDLYSGGPHLAASSFEVGNPDLEAESGLGIEAGIRYRGEGIAISASIFRSAINRYIYSHNTGDTNFRTLLPIYQAKSGGALMIGGEGSVEVAIGRHITARATASYVEGTLRNGDHPLPAVPPLNGRVNLDWTYGEFTASLGATWAAAQHRVAEFEETTDGFSVLDASVLYRLAGSTALHAIVLAVENALDTEYRRHLSRVKSIRPEAGRSFRCVYRLFF